VQNAYQSRYARLLASFAYGAVRRLTRGTCRGYSGIESFVVGKCGLEIGGPSPIFAKNKLIPVYDRCRRIDDCNFSSETIWGGAESGQKFGSSLGTQFVAEARNLSMIPAGSYDFVLASHVLEHIANPLQALTEWKRVLAPGGMLLVIVPDKRTTFDHRRPYTSFAHIQSDFENNTSEDDLTHMNEILVLHDVGLDPGVRSRQQFRMRCLKNESVRAMHHHVFSTETLIRMFTQVETKVLNLIIERPFHIIGIAQKPEVNQSAPVQSHNASFLREGADWKKI